MLLWPMELLGPRMMGSTLLWEIQFMMALELISCSSMLWRTEMEGGSL